MKTQTVDQHAHALEFQPATSSHVFSCRGLRAAYRIVLPAAILLLAISTCAATNALAQAAPPSSQSPAAGQKVTQILIPASLTSSVDSKKKKAGEEVVVKTAGNVRLADGTVISRGAKIVGHVTEAKARSGSNTQSSLGIVFDKINLSDGKTLTITGVIQAFAPNPNPDQGEGVNYGGMNQTLQHSTPTAGGTSPVIPILSEDSVGVQGVKNLQLGSDGVFKSDQKTVKLDYGSQVVLRAQIASGS
ncbi:MAG: hypothetical protein WAN60_14620 [Candidatus Sulfotelmatobacter sp.]